MLTLNLIFVCIYALIIATTLDADTSLKTRGPANLFMARSTMFV